MSTAKRSLHFSDGPSTRRETLIQTSLRRSLPRLSFAYPPSRPVAAIAVIAHEAVLSPPTDGGTFRSEPVHASAGNRLRANWARRTAADCRMNSYCWSNVPLK